jgi:hypothetical protein
MRIPRFASAAFLVGAIAVHAQVEAAAPPQGSCVVYSEVSHRDSHTLDVHLENTCKKPFACTVDWTVRCGKGTSATHNAARLDGSAEKSWVASAASCDEDWSIDTSWGCKPTK